MDNNDYSGVPVERRSTAHLTPEERIEAHAIWNALAHGNSAELSRAPLRIYNAIVGAVVAGFLRGGHFSGRNPFEM